MNNITMNNINDLKVINKFWAPIKDITESVEFFCLKNNYKNILEIGPGCIPFTLSTKSIGFNEKISDFIELDIDTNLLPYENNELDFVYSRHVLEDIQKNEIYFLPKYGNIIDYFLEIDQVNLDKMANLINNDPIYWNNYFIWRDIEPKIIMYKNGINFGLNKNMIKDYNKLINEAVNVSIQNTDYFVSNYVNK